MGHFPSVDLCRTGRNIQYLRLRQGMSVRDLQEAFGFSTPQAIYKWQRGDAMPTIDNLVVLAEIFNVSIDEILVLEEEK